MGDPPLGEPHGEDHLSVAGSDGHLASASGDERMQGHGTVAETRGGIGSGTDAPPFWTRHDRSISSVSYHSVLQSRPPPIQLEDHSEEQHELSQGCWAQSVTVDDYTIISGPSGIGAYVVWLCTVTTLKGGQMTINKRYSEFDRLHENLVKSFPHAAASIPELPRKSIVSRFRPKFLEKRKDGLNHFIKWVKPLVSPLAGNADCTVAFY